MTNDFSTLLVYCTELGVAINIGYHWNNLQTVLPFHSLSTSEHKSPLSTYVGQKSLNTILILKKDMLHVYVNKRLSADMLLLNFFRP